MALRCVSGQYGVPAGGQLNAKSPHSMRGVTRLIRTGPPGARSKSGRIHGTGRTARRRWRGWWSRAAVIAIPRFTPATS
jgi:hypothetical protein